MTTIAYDGKRIAADSQACWGEVLAPTRIQKLWHLQHQGSRIVVAGAGNPTALMTLARLFLLNRDRVLQHHALLSPPGFPKDLGGSLLVIDVATKRVFHMGEDATCFDITGSLAACGSGREFALGAMYHGANAMGAVEAAISFDPYSGGRAYSASADDGFDGVEWLEVV